MYNWSRNANAEIAAAALHCGFEGYLITHLAQIPGAQDVLSQLWKEYSKSDSRYLTADAFVTSIETVTVVCPEMETEEP